METTIRHKDHGKTAVCKSYSLYLCVFILIAIPFMFASASLHPAYAEGGDVVWQFADTPRDGKQESGAVVLDSAGYTIITGYSDQAGTEDYYTIRIDSSGVIVPGWPKTYDNDGGVDHAVAVVVDSSNNIIVTGHSQNANSNYDYHTIKYDGNGNVLWQESFDRGVNGNDFAVAVAIDGSNNVYVGGYSQNASGNDDFVLLKYPAAGGAPVWQATYNGTANGEDRIVDIASGVDGIAVTGESQNISLNFDIVTTKYDFDGNDAWGAEQRFNGTGSGDDRGISVAMDSAGNVLMTGTVFGTNKDIYTVKYDLAGLIVSGFEKTYNGGYNDEPADIFIDTSDNVYLTGYHTFADASYGFYTAKYNSAGALQWEDVFHSADNNNDRAVALVVDDSSTPDNSGAVFVTGYTFDNDAGNYDFQTIKYTLNSGKLLWQESFNGASNLNDRSAGIALTSTGDVIAGGWSEDSTDDYDYFVFKYERGLLNRSTDLALTVISTSQIDLAWTDNSTNETGFRIERKKGDAGAWSEIYIGTTPGETAYSDNAVDSDTKYYYRVRSYKSGTPDEFSNYSDEEYAVTTIQTYTPHAWSYTFDNQITNEDKVNAIAVGTDYHPVATGHSYSSLGTFDYYTVKLNRQNKAVIWAARYDGDQNDLDMATSIAVDGNNDVLVSGWSYLYSIAADENTNDIYTLKYLSSGPPEDWNHQYSGPAGDDDRSSVVDVSSDGLNSYVVVGYGKNVNGDDDIYVIKYDIDGNVTWEATPYDRGVSGNDYPVAAAFDPSGSIIVMGYSESGSDYDFFTAKYDSSGNFDSSWTVNPIFYDSTHGNDFAKAMAIDASGNVYVTGIANNANGNTDFYTVRYNASDGSIAAGWPQTYNGFQDGIDESVAIAIDPVNGEIVVGGTTYTTNSENDFHTIRYGTDGSVIWERTLDRPDNEDFAVTMGIDLSGNVYITGDTLNGAGPSSSWDILAVQYDHLGSFVNGTIVDGTDSDSDGVTSIAVNGIGEAFIGGHELNSNYDADYLVVKLDGDELQVPIPFEAAVHYVTVDFTWVDNSEDEATYQLQRNDNPITCDGAWTDIYNGTGTAYTDDDGGPPGLTPGTYYCYRIRTYKNASEYSRWVEKNITTVVLPPPAGLSATPLNTSEIYLTWTDTTTSENTFNIERCEAGVNCPGTAFAEIGEATTDDESYTDTTACAGTEYYYRINAQKTTDPGWTSGYSNETNTTAESEAAPSGLTTTWVSEVQTDLAWTNNTEDETGFKVERCATAGVNCPGTDFTEIGQALLDPSIVLLLNMDEGAWLGITNEAADSSGSGNHGIAVNGADTVTGGKYGYAGIFDGTDDYVEVQNNSNLNVLNDLTIELWFKPAVTYDSSLTDYVVLLDRQWSAGTDSYFLGINSDGKLHMGSNGGSIQSTQTTWTADTWYHVVITYRDVSGTYSGEIYINGSAETLSVDSYDNIAGGTQKVGIGGSDRFNNFTGLIDRVAVYNRSLTATEASDRFNNIVRYSDTSVPDVSVNFTYRVRAFKTATGCSGGEWNSAYGGNASSDSTIAAPGSFTATTVNTTRIDLEWIDNTASETGFKVFRCVEPCSIDYVNDEIIEVTAMTGQGDSVLYTDETACELITYRYGVKAVNNIVPWESLASNEDTATTDTGYAPGVLSATRVTESLVEMEWADNTDDETGFRIERCKGDLTACTNDFVVDVDGSTDIVTMPDGNVMLLHMDEPYWESVADEVKDSSGSDNHGARVNQATTDPGGRLSRAGIFDGSADYVTVPHSASLEGSGAFTLELWIKPIDQNNYQGLVSKGSYRYLFAINDSGSNYRLAYYGSGWQYGGTWVPYDEWTHAAVVYDGTNTITFYLNGQADGTRTIAGNQPSTGALGIGHWSNSYWYEGKMDEVAVYNRALTSNEIVSRYKNGLQTVLQGVATDGTTTTVADAGKAWTVNEWTNYYVYMETGGNAGDTRLIASNTSNTITVGTAFSVPVAIGDMYRIVELMSGTDSIGLLTETEYTYRILTYKTAAGCAGGEWNSDPSNMVAITTTAPVDPSALTANTINTTEIRLDWDDNTTSETDFEIERKCTAGDSCPDPGSEVFTRINIDGEPGPNDSLNATYTDDSACENTTYEYQVRSKKDPGWITGYSNIDSATTDDYIVPSGLIATTVTEEQIDLTWIDNTGDESSFKIERCDGDAATCASGPFTEIGTLGTSYGDLLVYHMDEPAWGTVIDSSEGGGNNGTAYGSPVTDPGGKFGWAGVFNGSSQYITTPLNIDQSSSSIGVTMAAWVKPTSTSGDWHHVISTDDDGYEWSLARYGNTWRVLTGNGSFNSGFTVDVNEWQHIAAVFTPGVGITVYKNGAAAATASITYNTDDQNVMIGRRARDSKYYFDGMIDEVAIHSGSLTFTDIYQLAEEEWKEDTGDIEDGLINTLQDTDKNWADDEWAGYYVVVLTGDIAGESRKILSNTSDTLTIENFSNFPDVGDLYRIETSLKGDAESGSTTTVTDTGKNWSINEWSDYFVVIESGGNAGQLRKIISNTSDTLTIDPASPFGSAVGSGNSYKILPYIQGAQSYGTKDFGSATGGTVSSVSDTFKAWTTNEWASLYVLMETGLNAGEISQISSNTSNTITVSTAFTFAVAAGDSYRIVTSQSYTKRYSDTGLTIGLTYSYRVRGFKVSTCPWPVEYSNIADAIIAPPAPTNLTAVSGGTTRIELEWTDNTETETGFKIYRCDGICTPDTVADPDDDFLVEVPGAVGTGIRSYTDTTVVPGVCESQTYTYSVVATSSSPVWDSASSNEDSATADTAPAPDGFTATQVSESRIDLSWNDNTVDETGFKLLRCESPCTPSDPADLIATAATDFEAFSDTGLAPDTTYNYRVHAFKTATCPWDKFDSASALTSSVTAPVLTSNAVNTTRIDLEWTDSTMSETGFTIERCEDGVTCPTFTEVTTVGPDVTAYSDTALCNSATYTHRVKAVKSGLSNNGGGCWKRRALLAITDFQPNYQTRVDISIYDADMQSDFDDIRFYDAVAGQELPYWIESKTDGDSAVIYIKTLVNDAIYMYYGNTSAVSSSDADRVYEFYDNFQGTSFDTAKWEEIDPNNAISQSNGLILNDSGSDSWTKALISQVSFDRAVGKELYISLTPLDTGGSNYFMVGWELNQNTSTGYGQLVHGMYWANSSFTTYEKQNNTQTNGSYGYSWGTAYEMKIVLLASGAKYYIKGGAYSDWTLMQKTTTFSDSPVRVAFTQHSHQANISLVKIKNYAPVEPSVAIGVEEQDDNCYTFSLWASPPYSNEVSKTTFTPVAPTGLTSAIINDTSTELIWTDNTEDETGFKVERCQGASCSPLPPEITTVDGYDPSVSMLLRMDELSWNGVSGEVLDSAGSNHGTAHFGANTTSAGFERAGSFDGVSDYVTVPNSTSINSNGAVTVGLWAASNTTVWNKSNMLASKRNAYILAPVSGTKEIRFYVYTTLQWYYTTFTPTIDITQWHHYAGTYDGESIKLYIDGVQVGTPTLRTGGINADPGDLYIGKDDGSSNYFNGFIDEVVIYNRALSASEVQALNDQGVSSNTKYLDTVSPSASYCYQVRAYKTAPGCVGAEWNTGYSNSTCAETPPGAPESLTATALNSLVIELAWDSSGVQNELGFEIERKIWGGVFVKYATVGPDTSAFYDTVGIQPEQTYTYRIRAYSALGDSEYSNEDSAVTPSWQEGDDTCAE